MYRCANVRLLVFLLVFVWIYILIRNVCMELILTHVSAVMWFQAFSLKIVKDNLAK